MYKKVQLIFFSVFLFFISCSSAYCDSNLDGPTGLIYIPSAYTGYSLGYYKLDGTTTYMINSAFFSNALELGYIINKDKQTSSLNLKLPLVTESSLMPQVAIGAFNYRSKAVGQTNYLVMSKSVDSLGLKLHAGYEKSGSLKDATGLFNYSTIQDAVADYKSDAGNTFVGCEFTIIPMVSIMGEKHKNMLNGGIRFRPLPIISLDYDILDIKNERKLSNKRVMNFNFSIGF